MWAVLIVTLPTRLTAVRLRIWRALKALGRTALRDGTYLLPLARAGLRELHRHDGKPLAAATIVFNALYAAPGADT
jgi:hypothetical protein